ncbi:ribonuclease H protein [Aureococcus anophagefferens]|nr:ribonuclease H protein [Aureococcus anophagefferens]
MPGKGESWALGAEKLVVVRRALDELARAGRRPDVVCLQETWGTEASERRFALEGYRLFAFSRGGRGTRSPGGGLATYVRSELRAYALEKGESGVVVELADAVPAVHIANVYRSERRPGLPVGASSTVGGAVDRARAAGAVAVVVGDFNVAGLEHGPGVAARAGRLRSAATGSKMRAWIDDRGLTVVSGAGCSPAEAVTRRGRGRGRRRRLGAGAVAAPVVLVVDARGRRRLEARRRRRRAAVGAGAAAADAADAALAAAAAEYAEVKAAAIAEAAHELLLGQDPGSPGEAAPRHHQTEILGARAATTSGTPSAPPTVGAYLASCVRWSEVAAAIAASSSATSPSPADGVCPPALKCGGLPLELALAAVFDVAMRTGAVTASWRTGYVRWLFKKGDELDPSCFRGIVLTSLVGKVFERVLLARLRRWALAVGAVPALQAVPCGSVVEHLATLNEVLAARRAAREPTWVMTVDIVKAYPSTCRFLLWRRLRELGLGGAALRLLVALFENSVRVGTAGGGF